MKKALVALCHNNLNVTKKFIDCALKELDSSYDLYILDNGSTDETYKYICDTAKSILHDDTKVGMYASRSETNLGFAGGNNYLLDRVLKNNKELAKLNHDAQDFYSNVILVNDDILFTRKSLERLVLVCNSNDEVGATGPTSNNVSGIQYVNIPGITDQNYIKYSEQLSESRDTHVTEVNTLIGFCLCLKLSVLKTVGLLDERFGIGSYEDNDYCLRIKNAGYKMAMVKESFVYHYGSQTVKQFDYMNIMIDNKYKFIEKYKKDIKDPTVIYVENVNTDKNLTCLFESKFPIIKCKQVTQDVLKQAAEQSEWCILLYADECGINWGADKIKPYLQNVQPDKDLICLKIAHIKSDRKIDLTKGADWQGRIMRLRKNSKGKYINFNEVLKGAYEYKYRTIFKMENENDIGQFIPYIPSKISAPIMVKNESKYMRLCLESIKDIVDEIIIVDTGSTDNTKEICKQYTDKIYDYKWDDSFANVRNFALEKCTGDWILRVDGDEEAPLDFKVNMYNAIINGEADAFLVPIKNFHKDGTTPISTTLRIFRNDKRLKYDGRVHEEIDTCIRNLGLKALKLHNYLLHYGYLKGIQKQKTDLYFKLLMLDYNDNPKNFKTLMNLANHYMHQDKYDLAASFYKDCIDNGGSIDPVILHDYAISKYKSLLSRNQEPLKEILAILDKAKSKTNACFPEQIERLNQNYNVIKGMILPGKK